MATLISFAIVVGLPIALVLGGRRRREDAVAVVVLTLIVVLAIVRSAVATRLDGLTYDEPYHIAAGVSYVRTGDFRLNPEHPPLAKLWAGAALSESVFEMPPFKHLNDKSAERHFTQEALYTLNDPDGVQRRTRLAMFLANALLFLSFCLAVRRLAGTAPAVGAAVFLALDPTVAAHLPVVMTDLPVALSAATAILTALLVLQGGRRTDVLAATLALGAALGAKHSGIAVALAVVVLGLVWTSIARRRGNAGALRRGASGAGVLLGAVLLLWGLYGFRHGGREVFNLPLADKVRDVDTPALRAGLELCDRARLLPQAYVWGLADVVHTGLEGRITPVYFFGRTLVREVPWYFFPGILAVKLPLGLTLLVLLGACWLPACRSSWPAVAVLAGFAVLYLGVLGSSSSAYAGVRHALPVVPALALLAGLATAHAATSGSRARRAAVALALLGAGVSALPVVRPWEYYNELVGGAAGAHHWFSDEGLDLGQRSRELVRYSREELQPAGRKPVVFYDVATEYLTREGLPSTAQSIAEASDDSGRLTGTFLVSATRLSPRPWYDFAAFREARPVDRRGNLLIFEGSFSIPWIPAGRLTYLGLQARSQGDDEGAERYLDEAVELYPQGFAAAIELGNLAAARGDRDKALRAFETALAHAPPGELVAEIRRHLELLATRAPEQVPPLRNPMAE